MILFRVQLQVSPAIRESVLKLLLRQMGPTGALRGCIACGAYVDVEDESTLVYCEEWEMREDLDRHLRSDDFKILLSVLDLASEQPIVRFDAIGETQGMEVIVAARAEKNGAA